MRTRCLRVGLYRINAAAVLYSINAAAVLYRITDAAVLYRITDAAVLYRITDAAVLYCINDATVLSTSVNVWTMTYNLHFFLGTKQTLKCSKSGGKVA